MICSIWFIECLDFCSIGIPIPPRPKVARLHFLRYARCHIRSDMIETGSHCSPKRRKFSSCLIYAFPIIANWLWVIQIIFKCWKQRWYGKIVRVNQDNYDWIWLVVFHCSHYQLRQRFRAETVLQMTQEYSAPIYEQSDKTILHPKKCTSYYECQDEGEWIKNVRVRPDCSYI